MKYWGYLAAKLAIVLGIAYGIRVALQAWLPRPDPVVLDIRPDPFATDLTYTFAMLLYFLVCIAMLWTAILDQRYRCRTCLRRLRMPVSTGSWKNVLFAPPRTEYICTYGHGTLKIEDLQISGPHRPDWQPHEDIWKELFPEETKK